MSRSKELQRKIDRYAGIPLAALIGLLTPKRPLPKNIRRIGLIQPTAIGDMILMSGLLASLSKHYPGVELYLIHSKTNQAAISLLETPVISCCCDFNNPVRSIVKIREIKLDVLLDLSPWPRLTALICRFSGARCTIGFRSAGQYRHWLYDIPIEHSSQRHDILNLEALLEPFGIFGPCGLHLKKDQSLPNLGLPLNQLILMHTRPGGSRALAKSWPDDRWVGLARALYDDGWYIGFTGTAQEKLWVNHLVKIIDRPDRCFSFCGAITLNELAALVQAVPLLVTVDTGVLHLASALNANVLGLHGPTASWRWGARNPRSLSLDSPHPSAGYICYGFEAHPDQFAVMSALSLETVLTAVRGKLSEVQENQSMTA